MGTLARLLGAATLLLLAISCARVDGPPIAGDDGLVFYTRHAATVDFEETAETIDLSNCETQRNLSEEGRQQAMALGTWLAERGIYMSTVLSSPFCRCIDTATLAFGPPEVVEDLATWHWSDDATQELRRERFLRRVSTVQRGHLGIAGHKDFIEALGLPTPGDGECVVLRPRGNGLWEHVGTIRQNPVRWEKAKPRRGN